MRGIQLTRWVVAAAAVSLAGCNCTPPEDCSNTYVDFSAPTDGATVGSPLDVTVNVTDKSGAGVELASATISTRLSSATEFSVPTPGALASGQATFGSVPMPAGENLIRVSVQKAGSTCSPVSKTIAVTVQDTSAPPEVTAFTFEGDSNTDGVLNSAELPANPAAVNALVTSSRALGCTLSMKYMGNSIATRTIDSATVTVSMPASGLANLVDGTYRLLADISCTDGRRNDPVTNTVATKDLIIDRLAPSCALLSPSKTLYGSADDDDTVTAGFQVRTLGQAGTDAVQMEIKLTGGATPQTTGPQSASGGTLSKDFTIPNSGTTAYTVELDVVDAAGNLCKVAKQVTADFDAPTFTISAPTAGAQTSYNLPVTIAVTNGDGSTVVVTTTPSGGSPQAVCGGTVSNGTFTCTGGAFVAGAQIVTVTVTDAAGNSSTQTVSINVTAPGCAIAFSTPSITPAVLTAQNDLQAGLPDLQYQFVAGSSTAGCTNKVVRLLRNGTLVDTGTTDGTGTYRSPTRTEPDSAGATISYRVEIDDGIGNTTFATAGVIVNLNAPVIVTPPSVWVLNTERDLDNATAGVQSQLVYSPAAQAGFKAVLCSSVQFGGGAVCPDQGGGFIVPGGDGLPTSSAAFTYPDGVYTIRMVFKEIAGTQTVSDVTAFNSLSVESVRPTVTAFTFQGDANNDKRLNIAESASGNPTALLTISNANGGTVVVRNRVSNTVVSGAPVTIAAGAASVPLAGLAASGATFEGDFPDLVAEVTTALGSKNMVLTPPPTGTTLNAAAFTSLRVDRVAPTCAMTSPNTAQLGIADDADTGTAGYQVRVAGSVPTDVSTNGVLLEMVPAAGAALTQTVTPAAGAASNNFTVPNSGETDYTARCTATDQSGNVGTRATRAVRVDLVAPTCTLVSPNVGGSPYTVSYSIATQVTVGSGDGLTPTIYTTVGAAAEQQIGQLPVVAGGTSSGTISYPSGAQTVRVEVVDAAGNKCTGASTQQAITVSVPGCSVTWSTPVANPAHLVRADDTAPGSTGTLEYNLTGNSNCNNQQMHFYRGTVTAGNEMAGSPINTSGTGTFSFPISLPDSDGATLETITAQLNNGNLTSFAMGIYVDLTLPGVTSVTPNGANLYFVSPSNSQLALSNYVQDTDIATAGAQYTVSVNTTGAVGGQLTVRYQGVKIAGPVAIGAANPTTVDVTLPHNSTGPLVTRVTDASGNIVDTTSTATVDVIAPAATVVSCTLVAGKEREAKVLADWAGSTTYDDGTDSTSGPVTKFDVRWTSDSVLAGGLQNSADYFDSNKAWPDSQIDPPATSQEVEVPPLGSTYCYVRARDEVYNYSPFPTTLPTAVANPGTRFQLSNPHPTAAPAQAFGRYMSAKGSLNNDNLDDLVVGYAQSGTASDPERVYVYYGANDGGFEAQIPQAITAPDAVVGAFGFDVSVGNAADVTVGENKPDLLVASPRANSSTGRVYLFFGTTSQAQISTAAGNYVTFVGAAAGNALGRTAQIIGDINGDGIGEIVMSAPSSDSSRGRVYLFYGRPVTGANSWAALAGGTLPGTPISVATADRMFIGPTPLVTASNDFGRVRGGITTIGTDFTIPDSQTSISSVFLFQAATVNGAAANSTLTTGASPVANQAFQTFLGQTNGIGTREGFGTRVLTNSSLVGNGGLDMMIAEPYFRKIYLYADRQSGSFLTTATSTVTGPAAATFFGFDTQVLDFSGDGHADMFAGGLTAGQPAYYLHNRGIAGSEFEATPGAPGSFWYTRINGALMGTGMATGDFNGDGKPDIAIADESDGNGKVFVWH